ncbi:MAG: hypothetical protein WCK84_12775 [Bacteroidota bacterium]
MKANLSVIGLVLVFIISVRAQNPNIQIGFSNEWPNEPSIAMNPMNTDVYLAISDDGGATFSNYKISDTPKCYCNFSRGY